MAINKKLIHFKTKQKFNEELANGNILETSIVFIQDSKEIYTHGQYYGDLSECLKVTQQILTDEEKTQVLENLGIEIPTKTSDLINDSGFISSQPMISVTWMELKEMRDGSMLVPGTWYRITDYMTTTSQEGTQSAGHKFDVVVLATGVNTLSEEARAAKHEGDTYFTENGANIDAWKIWYCLDNDRNRFPWAVVKTKKSIEVQADESITLTAEYVGTYEHEGVTYHRWDAMFDGGNFSFLTESDIPQAGDTIPYYGILGDGFIWEFGNSIFAVNEPMGDEGLGVIYRMIDESQNDVPYDFKNIQFAIKGTDGADILAYTFSKFDPNTNTRADLSFRPHICYNNKISASNSGLNKIVFNNLDSIELPCHSNTFGYGCHSNTFGFGCHSNTFGVGCHSNTFGFGCHSNTFGVGFYSNVVSQLCAYSEFKEGCHGWDFVGETSTGEYMGFQYLKTAPGLCPKEGMSNRIIIESDRTYETKVAYNSKGELKIYCEADLIN